MIIKERESEFLIFSLWVLLVTVFYFIYQILFGDFFIVIERIRDYLQ